MVGVDFVSSATSPRKIESYNKRSCDHRCITVMAMLQIHHTCKPLTHLPPTDSSTNTLLQLMEGFAAFLPEAAICDSPKKSSQKEPFEL